MLGEALAGQTSPEDVVKRSTADGLLQVRLEPLEKDSHAAIETPLGVFAGRDHRITITPVAQA